MGRKAINRFWWESGSSSASRNHLTTFCRPFVHCACLRLCSTIVHFIRNYCIYLVFLGWSAQALILLRPEIPSGMCAKFRTAAASNNRDHASQSLLLLLARATHIYFCSTRTSRSWWITQSTQRHRRGSNNPIGYNQGLQTFLSEGHIRCCTVVWGPDFLRNVNVSGKVAFHQITNLSLTYYFFIIDKMASWAAFGPRAVVWRPLG